MIESEPFNWFYFTSCCGSLRRKQARPEEFWSLIVEQWLLGRLRRRTFYSLAEVNAAIEELLARLNEERPIRRLGATRRRLLEEIDRPALKSSPAEPYEFCEWRVCGVGIDYHVDARAPRVLIFLFRNMQGHVRAQLPALAPKVEQSQPRWLLMSICLSRWDSPIE